MTIKAAKKSCVALVADDTDLLVLLLFHANNLVHDILMLPQHSTKKTHVWSVIYTKQQLNAEVTENLLFGHALMGCNTTSRLHCLGEGMIFKKLQNSGDLRNIGKIFNEEGKEQDEVIRAEGKALLLLYSNKIEETLDGLQLKKFLDKVSIKLS